MANPKFCSQCGQEIEEGARFCGKCGATLDVEVKTTDNKIDNHDGKIDNNDGKIDNNDGKIDNNSSNAKTKTAVIAAAAIIIAVIGGFFVFSAGKNVGEQKAALPVEKVEQHPANTAEKPSPSKKAEQGKLESAPAANQRDAAAIALKAEVDEARRKADTESAARKKAEGELAKLQADVAAAQKKAKAEGAAEQKAEAEAARQKAEAEAARQEAEIAQQKAAAEAAAKQQAALEAEAARQKAEASQAAINNSWRMRNELVWITHKTYIDGNSLIIEGYFYNRANGVVVLVNELTLEIMAVDSKYNTLFLTNETFPSLEFSQPISRGDSRGTRLTVQDGRFTDAAAVIVTPKNLRWSIRAS